MINPKTLLDKVAKGDFNLSREDALMLPNLMNSKKGEGLHYDWKNNTVWISKWDVTMKIEEIKQ